ncbi:5-hydroxytryptamine receptor 2A-like [Ptychodera flava]|uniref:5-hydroxytryptamine receptor 2A-like n=1 Tax=Ptychodera flava TaxID=63121 RepID=UPI00396AB151
MDIIAETTSHSMMTTNVTSALMDRDSSRAYGIVTVTVNMDFTSVGGNETNTSIDDAPLSESENNWPALFLVIVILCTVMGNVLVCLAIMTDKKLQSITNYFLMSLAVADLMVSLLVMPFGIIVEFAGHWPYGLILCDMYTFFDVLCCTASIMHLCTISVDRYLAISSPIKHVSHYRHSSLRVAVKILLVWIISIGLSCPLIALGLTDETNVLNDRVCALTNDYFKLYGSIVAFFIPLGIVILTYSLTVHKLRKKAQLCCDKPSHTVLRRYSFRRGSGSRLGRHFGGGTTRYSYSKATTSPAQKKSIKSPTNSSLPMTLLTHQNGNGVHTEGATTADSPKKSNSLRGPLQGKSHSLRKTMSNMSRSSAVSISNEQRATKVLGLVFFFFVICWAPFFFVNVLSVLCKSCYFPPLLMDFCLWLGYVASMINPILYTVFNKRFRSAFLATLTCSHRELKARDHAKCMVSGTCRSADRDTEKETNHRLLTMP